MVGGLFLSALNLAVRRKSATFAPYMKNLLPIVALLLVLACCTSEADRTRMRAGLNDIDQRNRSGQPFTAREVQPYVQFFDEHGTPNDQLLAHYLLGRAYYEHGEAPMALQCYHDAIECVDTTDEENCDFAQLSRVYGQMANVFYYQGLYKQQLLYDKVSVKYALLGNDILAALQNYEQEGFAYNGLGLQDSAIYVIEDVAAKYEQYGYPSDAAISLGVNIRPLIDRGDYDKAKHCMDIYESKSGLFDTSGNIAKGREIYYKSKGLYYLYTDKLDSAEYYFRKELQDGRDFNNQNAGAKGLTLLYQRLHKPDSVAKYSLYSYAMSDSLYAQRTSKEIERMQAMYDYTRHQEIARKKSEEARQNKEALRFIFTLFIGFVFTIAILSHRFICKRREGLVLYMQSLEELKQLRADKVALSQHQEEFYQIIQEKDKKIDYLEQRVKKYGKQVYFNPNRSLEQFESKLEYMLTRFLMVAIRKLPLQLQLNQKVANQTTAF